MNEVLYLPAMHYNKLLPIEWSRFNKVVIS
jgi:hypothetical protein